MKKTFRCTLLIACCATLPAAAQEWSLGAGTGPFVFGTFAERFLKAGTEQPSPGTSSIKLTAKTRPGLSVDLERSFSDRFALRAEATFTEAPLQVKAEGEGVGLDAGKIDVTTIAFPLILRLNPHGTFRFTLHAGPAYAIYHTRRLQNADATLQAFRGSREDWGAVGGAGVEWWLRRSIAVTGQIQDIVTASPFDKSDFGSSSSRIKIPKPHNVHTTVGVRWRF